MLRLQVGWKREHDVVEAGFQILYTEALRSLSDTLDQEVKVSLLYRLGGPLELKVVSLSEDAPSARDDRCLLMTDLFVASTSDVEHLGWITSVVAARLARDAHRAEDLKYVGLLR